MTAVIYALEKNLKAVDLVMGHSNKTILGLQ